MPKKSSVLGAAALALFGYTLLSSDSIGQRVLPSSNLRNANGGPAPRNLAEKEEYDLTKRIGKH